MHHGIKNLLLGSSTKSGNIDPLSFFIRDLKFFFITIFDYYSLLKIGFPKFSQFNECVSKIQNIKFFFFFFQKYSVKVSFSILELEN